MKKEIITRIEQITHEFGIPLSERILSPIFPHSTSCFSIASFVLGITPILNTPEIAVEAIRQLISRMEEIQKPEPYCLLLCRADHSPELYGHAGVFIDRKRVFHQRIGGGDIETILWKDVEWMYYPAHYYRMPV